MNKPSRELVLEWKNKCTDKGVRVTHDYIDTEKLCKLAASWGAEQAVKNHILLNALESAKAQMQDGQPHTLTMTITREGYTLLADAVALTKDAEVI